MINVDQEATRQWSKDEFYQYMANIFAKSHYDYISDYIRTHHYSRLY